MPADLQSIPRRFAGYLPYVAVVLAGVSVVLGYFGFRALATENGPMPWENALYHSIGLFVLEGNVGAAGRLPLPLNIARFLAAALTGYAVLLAALVLLRGVHDRLRRKRFRRHRIIFGLGRRGRFVAINAAQSGRGVVAVDSNPDPETVTTCVQQGISLIKGSAADSTTLADAGITRASEVYIFTRDDNLNLEIAHAIRGARAGARGAKTLPPLECYLSVGEIKLVSLIPAHQQFLESPANMRVHAFNSHQNAARDLWHRMVRLAIERNQCLPLASSDARTAHFFIAGSGALASAVFGQIVRLAHFANLRRTRITLIDPGSRQDFSGLSPVLDVRTISAGIGSMEATDAWTSAAVDPNSLVSIVVCGESEAEGLRSALDVNDRARPAGLNIPVFVLTAYAAGIHEFLEGEVEANDLLLNVHGFGALTDTCSLEAILRPRTTALAMAIMKSFLTVGDSGEGGHTHTDPNAREDDWNKLPEYLKETNRAAAEHIRIKCLALGINTDAGEVPDEAAIGKHLEILAEVEHRRWLAEKLITGWKPGAKTDPLIQTHQNLVPWSQLTESEKEKDRVVVRAIPRILRSCRSIG